MKSSFTYADDELIVVAILDVLEANRETSGVTFTQVVRGQRAGNLGFTVFFSCRYGTESIEKELSRKGLGIL